MLENKEMRTVMVDFLMEQMSNDDKIITIDADLAKANGTFRLQNEFPDRALNVGIAEANMASMAAGLASYGYKPFIFSFCPFVTRRIADQVAVSIAYAGMNVKIVGTDPGITAQLNGATHLSVEDIGIMRSIPNIAIYEPIDCYQYAKALPSIMEYEGPMYIRQLRKMAPCTYFNTEDYEFDLFKADLLKKGKDITLFASGIEVDQAMKASELLSDIGIDCEVISIHTIKPLDKETVINSVKKTGRAVVCENHNIIGGLGSGIAEVLSQFNPVPLEFIGIRDRFGEVGDMDYLLKALKMDSYAIVDAAKKVLSR